MTNTSVQQVPESILSSGDRGWQHLEAEFVHVPRGIFRVQSKNRHSLGIHFGPAITSRCSVDGEVVRRVQRAGDIDIVPAGVDGMWEDESPASVLSLTLHPAAIERAAHALGHPADHPLIRPRLHVRDARIASLGWAIKTELEATSPASPRYIDHLADALAIRLIEVASERPALIPVGSTPRLSARELATLTEYIEGNLEQRITLDALSRFMGMSVTKLKLSYRNRTGGTLHQYVIRRRVERARRLLTTTDLPISDIAAATGFAHQSHMTAAMRKLLGQTPAEIARTVKAQPRLRRLA